MDQNKIKFNDVVILRQDVSDSDLHKFKAASLKNISGERVPVCLNFDHSKSVGHADIKHDKKTGLLVADIELDSKFLLSIPVYPAIAGNIKECSEQDGVTVIEEFELSSISLSHRPNVDPEIKPLEFGKKGNNNES